MIKRNKNDKNKKINANLENGRKTQKYTKVD
jgi:hypothetical protein